RAGAPQLRCVRFRQLYGSVTRPADVAAATAVGAATVRNSAARWAVRLRHAASSETIHESSRLVVPRHQCVGAAAGHRRAGGHELQRRAAPTRTDLSPLPQPVGDGAGGNSAEQGGGASSPKSDTT